jgi:hypothetical protein
VWPHDNGIIASGFVRYGHREWLRSEATHGRLRIVEPCLPAGLVELCVSDLRVGEASVDLVFRRSAKEVEVDATVSAGSLHVDVDG